jgi:hypothetical protein
MYLTKLSPGKLVSIGFIVLIIALVVWQWQIDKAFGAQPTTRPSTQPSMEIEEPVTTTLEEQPTTRPSTQPTTAPTSQPSTQPTTELRKRTVLVEGRTIEFSGTLVNGQLDHTQKRMARAVFEIIEDPINENQ